MTAEIEYLSLDDLIELTTLLMGDPPPMCDIGLLGAAAARPKTSAFGEDAYPNIWTKAAALLQSVVKNRALIDGNKRLAWMSTAVFLEINGVSVTGASNNDVYTLVMDLAAGDFDVASIAERLTSLAGE